MGCHQMSLLAHRPHSICDRRDTNAICELMRGKPHLAALAWAALAAVFSSTRREAAMWLRIRISPEKRDGASALNPPSLTEYKSI